MAKSLSTFELPTWKDTISYIKGLNKKSVATLLEEATRERTPLLQPRCGVGGHIQMQELLKSLEVQASPDVLSLTIDAHTRLKHFDKATELIKKSPGSLNGYPLVSHGWKCGRELNESVNVPLQVRHGSPDPTRLFEESIASGITSFEGGGISYNLPYSKNVPLEVSLKAWSEVDEICGQLAREGIVVDRELFGTLTAVLVPPSISISVSLLEAILATGKGVECISIAYPQTGVAYQDIAALKAIAALAQRYLPPNVAVYPVFHEFMGVFPKDRGLANAIILYGALIGKAGGAAKVITKTYDEAFGIPTVQSNIEGLRLARASRSFVFDSFSFSQERVQEEQFWIEKEVEEILNPVLESSNLEASIVESFKKGTLDIPFSASQYAKSAVLPLRDSSGAIRYESWGGLPFGRATSQRNKNLLSEVCAGSTALQSLTQKLMKSIHYFSEEGAPNESLHV